MDFRYVKCTIGLVESYINAKALNKNIDSLKEIAEICYNQEIVSYCNEKISISFDINDFDYSNCY